MWTRVQLKDKAKRALDKNYWKIVLVSLLAIMIAGGSTTQLVNTVSLDADTLMEYGMVGGMTGGITGGMIDNLRVDDMVPILLLLFIVFSIVFLLVGGIGFLYKAFLTNPLDAGAKRFFYRTLNEKAEIKEVAFTFDNNYKNVVKILFMKDLKLFLWSLLFIVPGIVKAYEYYMVPYLLAENPNLTQEEAFRYSKQMMSGNKWETFVLELSFIGWDILSAMTAGILDTFYVLPYKNLTFAALYEELSAINGYPARAAFMSGMRTPCEASADEEEEVPSVEATPVIEENTDEVKLSEDEI